MASNPDSQVDKPAGAKFKLNKKTLIMGGGALLVVVLAAGGWMMMSGGSDHADDTTEEAAKDKSKGKAAKPAPIYHALDPAFVVNLADEGGIRYLQVDIQVMAREQAAIDAVNLHMPVIRNQLLLLFSQQRSEDIRSREARESLQAQALAEIRKILKAETGKPGIEALYFTSFVTQ